MEQEYKPVNRLKKLGFFLALVLILGLMGLFSFLAYAFVASPSIIKSPSQEHYHFRMQIIINGKSEDFSKAKYQESYSKDSCNVELTTRPIHFHDNKNQIVHIHWEGVTGGLVLKYYGWNEIGSPEGYLGYRFDNLPKLVKVPIHGYNLPQIDTTDRFFIYSGDGNNYLKRDFNDFLNKDLERFFNKTSTFPTHKFRSSALNLNYFSQKTYAHGAVKDDHNEDNSSSLDNAELTRLNNLIGNVVIFVQKVAPLDSEIKERFNQLEPLSTSVCGG
jgi:hypothetical protein